MASPNGGLRAPAPFPYDYMMMCVMEGLCVTHFVADAGPSGGMDFVRDLRALMDKHKVQTVSATALKEYSK